MSDPGKPAFLFYASPAFVKARQAGRIVNGGDTP